MRFFNYKDDAIINQRLDEHESENSNVIPSVSRCINDLMSFFNAYLNDDPSMFLIVVFLIYRERKRYTVLSTLDSYKFLMERLPNTEESLRADLDRFTNLQEDFRFIWYVTL